MRWWHLVSSLPQCLTSAECQRHTSSVWPWSGAPKVRMYGTKVRMYSTNLDGLRQIHVKGVGYMAWKWIRISLESRMVSWYKNKIVRAGVSNCMHQCLNFLEPNVHIPTYLGSRGEPFFWNFEVFSSCLPIVDQYEFVYNNLYCMNLHTLIM